MKKLLNIFNKDREDIIESFISGVVKDITENWEHKFSYEEQSFIFDEISRRILDVKKVKRNELIREAREIQNSLK